MKPDFQRAKQESAVTNFKPYSFGSELVNIYLDGIGALVVPVFYEIHDFPIVGVFHQSFI